MLAVPAGARSRETATHDVSIAVPSSHARIPALGSPQLWEPLPRLAYNSRGMTAEPITVPLHRPRRLDGSRRAGRSPGRRTFPPAALRRHARGDRPPSRRAGVMRRARQERSQSLTSRASLSTLAFSRLATGRHPVCALGVRPCRPRRLSLAMSREHLVPRFTHGLLEHMPARETRHDVIISDNEVR